jgi:hypothetical protein
MCDRLVEGDDVGIRVSTQQRLWRVGVKQETPWFIEFLRSQKKRPEGRLFD